MAKLVFNIRKHKGNGSALSNHIDRVKGKEHMYKNADSTRTHLNVNYSVNKFCNMKLSKAIAGRIEEGYKGKRKIRQDAVKSLGLVLTGSHKEMKKIFSNQDLRKRWLNQSYDFLKENFGKENIVRLSLHLDETTPHLHAVVVPLTDDGRLSARERMGNRTKLKRLRKAYAEKLKEFNLEYGIERNTENKPLSTKISDFYSLIKNFDDKYQKKLKTLKTANFKKLSPRQKTAFLEELGKVVKIQNLNQDIFDKYLTKFSTSKKQKI